jgi:hypothetical protein
MEVQATNYTYHNLKPIQYLEFESRFELKTSDAV